MKHEKSTFGVWGAAFNDDQRLVLTWSADGTARLWDISADYDFPPEKLPLLVQVVTGTEMDDIGIVSALPPDEWYRLKEEYVRVAEDLKTCRYPDANLYVRQKAFWQPEGR